MNITILWMVLEEDIAGEEPMFIEPLVFEQNGMNITLKCSVIGYPIPYVTFHRRNRRIPSDTHSGSLSYSIYSSSYCKVGKKVGIHALSWK